MPAEMWKNVVDPPTLCPSKTMLKALRNSVIPHVGVPIVVIKLGKRMIDAKMYITRYNMVPILGLKASVLLGLVKLGKRVTIDAISEKKSTIGIDSLKSE